MDGGGCVGHRLPPNPSPQCKRWASAEYVDIHSFSKMLLIEDCVETSGAFLIHHLLKLSFSPHSSGVVVFLSFAHPFSHYDRILRKMGCNLVVQRDKRRLIYFDMLTQNRDKDKTTEDFLRACYGEVHKAVECSSSPEATQQCTVIIDDVSLLEIRAKGSTDLALDFLHYCFSLTAQFGGSLILLNHEDVYSIVDKPSRLLQLVYLADVVIKVEPLASGLAAEVHGQLTVINKALQDRNSGNKISNFQFKIKDTNVEYFYPGTRT